MKLLAIETSCDDTALAIVSREKRYIRVKATLRQSQKVHKKWGGVVPELAAREHEKALWEMLPEIFFRAKLSPEKLDGICVTVGPGLVTSLLTGTHLASFLSLLTQKPLIPVHHIYGHIASGWLERPRDAIPFPCLALTVSGGHTQMHLGKDIHTWQCIGSTLDDAAGEAFDKLAKMLHLGYPGGPIVSEKAKKGNPFAFRLPKPLCEKGLLDFSFSGLKAALFRIIANTKKKDAAFVADLCASFQHTVAEVFLYKIKAALAQYPEIASVLFVGGVSANTYIQQYLEAFLSSQGIPFFRPLKAAFSTDNAEMIGGAGIFTVERWGLSAFSPAFTPAYPRLSFSQMLAQPLSVLKSSPAPRK